MEGSPATELGPEDRRAPSDDDLLAWFGAAQRRGLLGPSPVEGHVRHADRFVEALGVGATGRCLDLGTGAGVPGLVLACRWPSSTWVLLDGKDTRIEALGTAVEGLGLAERVRVECARAEVAARDPGLREQFDLVVARAFGPPAVVAECAAAFLRLGGRLAVSEPPEAAGEAPGPRWSAGTSLLEEALGLRLGAVVNSIQVLEKVAPTPANRPRRVGVPTKRPLF